MLYRRNGKYRRSECGSCQDEYHKKYYRANKEKRLGYARQARKRNRAYVYNYLSTRPCIDCGESDPIILEFDHIGEKSFNVGNLIGRTISLLNLQKEMDRCVIRCANCHRIKTAKQRSYHRNLSDESSIGQKRRRKLREYLWDYLKEHPCVDCGINNFLVLDFDHTNPTTKVDKISSLVSNKMSLSSVKLEVEKCEVRCANCHRLRTNMQLKTRTNG